jgi:hypothetical protein
LDFFQRISDWYFSCSAHSERLFTLTFSLFRLRCPLLAPNL